MLKGLRSRLKKNPRISGLRLSIAEKFLPADYYVQLRPPYATHTWEVDRRRYDEKHDWDNFRDGNRVLQAHVILDRVKRCASGDYAELGTYQGNYARIIYSQMVEGTRLYCFDTFTGFPEISKNSQPPAMPCLSARFPTPLRRKWNTQLLGALHHRALSCAPVNSQQPS